MGLWIRVLRAEDMLLTYWIEQVLHVITNTTYVVLQLIYCFIGYVTVVNVDVKVWEMNINLQQIHLLWVHL